MSFLPPALPELRAPEEIADFPGFPTYAEYKLIEDAHLSKLSTVSRQEKSLISQVLFDRIWEVLTLPWRVQGPGPIVETPQFRSWARKNFTLGSPPSSATNLDGAKVALLSKGSVVAVREQLYQILCYCHGEAGHGPDRAVYDATQALVSQRYSHVPKGLVERFLDACPSCYDTYSTDSVPTIRVHKENIVAPPHYRAPSFVAAVTHEHCNVSLVDTSRSQSDSAPHAPYSQGARFAAAVTPAHYNLSLADTSRSQPDRASHARGARFAGAATPEHYNRPLADTGRFQLDSAPHAVLSTRPAAALYNRFQLDSAPHAIVSTKPAAAGHNLRVSTPIPVLGLNAPSVSAMTTTGPITDLPSASGTPLTFISFVPPTAEPSFPLAPPANSNSLRLPRNTPTWSGMTTTFMPGLSSASDGPRNFLPLTSDAAEPSSAFPWDFLPPALDSESPPITHDVSARYSRRPHPYKKPSGASYRPAADTPAFADFLSSMLG